MSTMTVGFFGLTCEAGKTYKQTADMNFRLTMAALSAKLPAGATRSSITVTHEGKEFTLCSLLPGQVEQQPLDITFLEGEEVTFTSHGNATIDLIGNYVMDAEAPYSDEDYEEEEDEEEEGEMMSGDESVDSDGNTVITEPRIKEIKGEKGAEEESDGMSEDDEEEDSDVDLADLTTEEIEEILEGTSDDEVKSALSAHLEQRKRGEVTGPSDGEEDSEEEIDLSDLEADELEEILAEMSEDDEMRPEIKDRLSKKRSAAKADANTGPAKKAKVDEKKAEEEQKPMTKKERKAAAAAAAAESAKAVAKKEAAAKPAAPAAVEEKKGAEPKQKGEQASPVPAKKTLPSGLVMEDVIVGKGTKAKNGKTVFVRYIGKLTNGKVFDSNVKGSPFSFKLGANQVIRGWDIGVSGMNVGGTRKLTIPAPLAYGSKGALPDIPKNATLEFEVKLLDVKGK